MTSEIIIKINEAIECAKGQHEFEKINDGNVRCKKCGRFAKVGHLRFDNRAERRGEQKNDKARSDRVIS